MYFCAWFNWFCLQTRRTPNQNTSDPLRIHFGSSFPFLALTKSRPRRRTLAFFGTFSAWPRESARALINKTSSKLSFKTVEFGVLFGMTARSSKLRVFPSLQITRPIYHFNLPALRTAPVPFDSFRSLGLFLLRLWGSLLEVDRQWDGPTELEFEFHTRFPSPKSFERNQGSASFSFPRRSSSSCVTPRENSLRPQGERGSLQYTQCLVRKIIWA